MKEQHAARAAAQTIELQLQPHNHLRKIGEGKWEALGNDPCFRCLLPEGGIEAGWYEIDADLELLQGPGMWSYMYPDYGDPELERHKAFVPLLDDGAGRRRGVVLFTNNVRRLRFDTTLSVYRLRLVYI